MENMRKAQWTESDSTYVRRWGGRFLDDGTVHTKEREYEMDVDSITDEEAKTAAMILKSGYTESFDCGHGRTHEEHHYFTTLTQALEKSPQLRAIKEKYELTNRAFMQAMYAADPLLKRRRIHIKYDLDEDLKQERKDRAYYFLNKTDRDPDWLKRVYFVDECSIAFDHVIRKGVHVYCDAHDKGYRFVIPFKKLNPSQKIKVRILAAVNYHDGTFFLEFMTGTTNVCRQFNYLPGQTTQHKYKVSVVVTSLGANNHNAPSIVVDVAARQLPHQHLCICQHLAFCMHAHCSVGSAQHNAAMRFSNSCSLGKEVRMEPSSELYVMHPDHTHSCLNPSNIKPQISGQSGSTTFFIHTLAVGRTISLQHSFLAEQHKIHRCRSPWHCNLPTETLAQACMSQLLHKLQLRLRWLQPALCCT